MKNTLTKFERFLFKPTTPIGLGLFRIFYYLSVMLFAHNAFAEMQFNRSSVLYETIGIFKFLPELQTTDYLTTLLLYKIFQFLSFCALIGLGAMPIRICVFIVGAYTFGNQYNFQIYHQHDSFVIISLFILISAELNECWSVDSLLFRSSRFSRIRNYDGSYLQIIKLYWVFVFFSAGIYKFHDSGLAWASQDSLRKILVYYSYFDLPIDKDLRRWGQLLLQHEWITMTSNWISLFTELFAPVALFGGVWTALSVGAVSLLMFAIHTCLHPIFLYGTIPISLVWLPWDLLAERLKNRIALLQKRFL